MSGRVFATLVIGFWLAMMAALVRMEFFPQPMPISAVSNERVLARLFANPEPARLNIFYQGAEIGFCNVEMTPAPPPGAGPLATNSAPGALTASNHGWRVHSELTLTLSVFGMPSRLRLKGDTFFDRHYAVEDFRLNAMVGESNIDISGDAARRRVVVQYLLGDKLERREFGYDEIQNGGLAGALGMPGLGNLGFLAGSAGRRPAAAAAGPATTTCLGTLQVGETTLRAYIIEARLGQTMWARMWVSELGEVLQVDSSIGLSMLADVLTRQTGSARRQAPHDSH